MGSTIVRSRRPRPIHTWVVGFMVLGGWTELGMAKDPLSFGSAKSLAKTADPDKVHLINQQIADKWSANKLTPSARASDYEFLRRASLDIIGRIATPKEMES